MGAGASVVAQMPVGWRMNPEQPMRLPSGYQTYLTLKDYEKPAKLEKIEEEEEEEED